MHQSPMTRDEGESPSDIEDEDESVSQSSQDSPHAKGGKPSPLRVWADRILGKT